MNKLKHPPFPMVMGQPLKREEIIEGLRTTYNEMLSHEQKSDPTIKGYPDMAAILDYCRQRHRRPLCI